MGGWAWRHRRGRDQGASTLEYGALLLLVSAIVAGVTLVAIPDTVASKTRAAVCSIFSGKDCDPGEGGGGDVVRPSPLGSGPVQGPPSSPPVAGPVSLEQQQYDNAKKNADIADQDARNAEGEFGNLQKELLDFLIDLIGITDAKECLTKGDIISCISLAADLVPWGKAFKLLKKLPEAFKLAKRFKGIWDKVSAARKKRDEAQKALKDAEDRLKKKQAEEGKKKPACPTKSKDTGLRPHDDGEGVAGATVLFTGASGAPSGRSYARARPMHAGSLLVRNGPPTPRKDCGEDDDDPAEEEEPDVQLNRYKEKYLEKKLKEQYDTDPHELKAEYVGKRNVARFDCAKGSDGKIWLVSKDGKTRIPTDYDAV